MPLLSVPSVPKSMDFFHGTPIGGKRADIVEFLRGRCALVPYPRQDDMATVAVVCAKFLLDNGAYSYWRKGFDEYPDYEGYVAWVEEWSNHPAFCGAFIPDHISGTEEQNNEYLRRWPKHLKGIPVYHMHHSLERLRWLAQNYETVALGGSHEYPILKSKSWWERIGEMMDAICDDHGRPMCKLHGLRMLDRKVCSLLPLTSGDSVNAARNSGNKQTGEVIYTRLQRATQIAERIENQEVASTWRRRPKQLLLF